MWHSMNDDEKLDLICKTVLRTDTLNSLEQCRSDYQTKNHNTHKWRNAYALVQQLPHLQLPSASLLQWLEEKANQEFNLINSSA